MSEDHTWDGPIEPTRAQLAQRVRELEAQNAALLAAAVQNAQDMLTLRVENSTLVRRARGLEDDLETANETIAALSAQIDETPYSSIWKFVHGTDSTETRQIVRTWLEANTSDYDDDTDAPLKLAQIDDEDGDL